MSIILYEHIDFLGAHKHIMDRDEPNLHADGWGDRVSSIQIQSGRWEFWQHVNYGGNRVVLGPGSYRWVRDVGIANDQLSSVRRASSTTRLATPGIVLFEHINFRGAHKHVINRDVASLHRDGWGDRVSSIVVISGRWEICQHVDYRGWRFVLGPGIYPWVEDVGIGNDRVSSVRRFQPAVPVAPLVSFETILYEHIDFGGDHKHLICRGERTLHSDNWGDRVSSLQVITGNQWQFFVHHQYQGESIRLGPGNYRWIRDAGLPNDTLSSVRANQVPAYFVTIQGATANIAGNVTTANTIYNRYQFNLWNLGGHAENAVALLDLDQPTCFRGQTPTAEENQLYNIARDRLPQDVVVYYLRSTSLAVRGCAAHPANRPGAVVCDSATQYTLAHELGHVLGLNHVNDTTNLMNSGTAAITKHPPDLSDGQLTTVRGSQWYV